MFELFLILTTVLIKVNVLLHVTSRHLKIPFPLFVGANIVSINTILAIFKTRIRRMRIRIRRMRRTWRTRRIWRIQHILRIRRTRRILQIRRIQRIWRIA